MNTWASLVAQMVKNLAAMQETQETQDGLNLRAGKTPRGRKWQSAIVLLPGKCHGAWRATVHGVAESDMT